MKDSGLKIQVALIIKFTNRKQLGTTYRAPCRFLSHKKVWLNI